MRTYLVALAFLGLLPLHAPARGQKVDTPPGGEPMVGQMDPASVLPESVPYQLWDGLITIAVTMPDGLPHRAGLMTALPLCALTATTAALVGAKPAGMRPLPVLDRTVQACMLKPMPVRVGRLGATDVPCALLDVFAELAGSTNAMAPDTWLGNSFLAITGITIDPVKERVIFRKLTDRLPGKAAILPFELKDGRIWIQAQANDKASFAAMVDTGSVGTFLPARVAQELALKPVATVPATLPGGKDGKVAVADLAALTLGSARVPGVQALYVADPASDGLPSDFAVIGNDILLRFRVTIDYRQRKIAFEKVKLPIPQPASGAGPPAPGTTPPVGGRRPPVGPGSPPNAGARTRQ